MCEANTLEASLKRDSQCDSSDASYLIFIARLNLDRPVVPLIAVPLQSAANLVRNS